MKGEISGSPSSDNEVAIDENPHQQSQQRGVKKSKTVRRRWHVPHVNTVTPPSPNQRPDNPSQQQQQHNQQGVELRGLGLSSATDSPLQQSPSSVRRKDSLALDVTEEDSPNGAADSSLAALEAAEKSAKKKEKKNKKNDSSNKNNRSEAKLFASEVKRYSKETITKGRRNLRKKFNRFFRNNPEFDTHLSPMGDSEENWKDDEDNGKRKGRGCAITMFWLQLIMPCVGWLRTYKFKEYFPSDAIAGISVAMMVVPQSISYAALAGLPSEFGLYTALIPVFVYALFGSSRQLAVGPVAIVSLLMKEGLHKAIPASLDIQDPNNPQGEDQIQAQMQYSLMAVQVTFIVGIIELMMGLARLGFLTNFLSHSVILGFTHGSAILIGLSQIKHVIGIKAKNSNARVQDFISCFTPADTFLILSKFSHFSDIAGSPLLLAGGK